MLFLLFCSLLTWRFQLVFSGDEMLGKGKWAVLDVRRCPEEIDYPVTADLERHKYNRSHDSFDAKLIIDKDIDDSYAIRIEVCQFVDGGCKPYQTIADDSLPRFCKKYAEENVIAVLELAGLDPPDFPIPAGEYDIVKYILNYDDLPPEAVYGKFRATIFLIKDNLEAACILAVVEFTKKSDEDDDDEEDE